MTHRPPRWLVVGPLLCLALAFALLTDSSVEAQGGTLNQFEQEVLNLVNQQRAANGLSALTVDSRLVTAARNHNNAMISSGVFAHQVPGELPLCANGVNNDRYEAVGYAWNACGENIAAGQTTPAQVMADWMGSSGHRANILNGNYVHIGIGYTTGGSYGHYWTQDFGRSSGGTIATATRTNTPAASATRTPTAPAAPTATRTPTRTATPPVGATPPTLHGVTTGVYRPSNGNVYMKNANTSGFADIAFFYGNANDKPVAGDWNGDGIESVGIYRDGTFYLKNANASGFADLTVAFGGPGDLPVAGDWNGDGVDTIGVYRNGIFFLRNSNTSGPADLTFAFGGPGDQPVAGNWDGTGGASIGIFRSSNSTFYLRNANSSGPANIVVNYGAGSDLPVVGDWNNDGTTTIGLYRSGMFLLRNSNTSGGADITFMLGGGGDQPIAGDWDNRP